MSHLSELPVNASTWGYSDSRLVYLAKFNLPLPINLKCPECKITVSREKARDKQEDDWEKHMLEHRVWKFADTGKRYNDGLSKHHICEYRDWWFHMSMKFDQLPLFCSNCGGYISVDAIPRRDSLQLCR